MRTPNPFPGPDAPAMRPERCWARWEHDHYQQCTELVDHVDLGLCDRHLQEFSHA